MNTMPPFAPRPFTQTAFWLLIGLFAGLLAGCSPIPIPNPIKLSKKPGRLPWRDRAVRLTSPERVEIPIKSGEDTRGVVRLFKHVRAGDDGVEFGALEFWRSDGFVHRVPAAWQGLLVDAAEIRWPSGEAWALFAWDFGNTAWYRTISLFDPRRLRLYSCELSFEKNDEKQLTGRVEVRFSWSHGEAEAATYRRFLDTVKIGYADPDWWGAPTRGTVRFRQGEHASATYRPASGPIFQDDLLRRP
jgi:hypothetical protein